MTTTKFVQKIEIFVSSPSDVQAEREVIARIVERLNRLSYIRERYYLQLMAYEQSVPPVVGSLPQTVVNEYMMKAEHSDLLICVLWSRMGTPVRHPDTGEDFQSGTEYEFMSAYRANQKTGKPYILLYQKAKEAPSAEQKKQVEAFFKRFEGDQADFKGLYKRYTTLAEFEEMVFHHIEQVIAKNLIETGRRVDAASIPAIREETRRLDAAMPGRTKVGRPTEVWVQLCLPSSEGFRSKLPQYTKSRREEITTKDVRSGGLAVAFPVDRQSGEAQPVLVRVELRASNFTLDEPFQEVLLWPQSDSGLLVFNLTPKQARGRSVVHVIVRQTMPDGPVITLGSAALATQVLGASAVYTAAHVAWTLLSLPLAAVELGMARLSELPESRLGALPPSAEERLRSMPAEEEALGSLFETPDIPKIDDPFGLFSDEDDDLPEQAVPGRPAAAPRPPVDAAMRARIAQNEVQAAPQAARRSSAPYLLRTISALAVVTIVVGALALYAGGPSSTGVDAPPLTKESLPTPILLPTIPPSPMTPTLPSATARPTLTAAAIVPTREAMSPHQRLQSLVRAHGLDPAAVRLSDSLLRVGACSESGEGLREQAFEIMERIAVPVAELREAIGMVRIVIWSCADSDVELYRASAPLRVITRYVDNDRRDPEAYRAGWQYVDLF